VGTDWMLVVLSCPSLAAMIEKRACSMLYVQYLGPIDPGTRTGRGLVVRSSHPIQFNFVLKSKPAAISTVRSPQS